MKDLKKEVLVKHLLGLAASHQATLGQRLVSARLRLGLTQARVAELVPCQARTGDKNDIPRFLSRTAYCMYELNSSEPSLRMIEKLSQALHVSPAWIAFGENTNHRKRS